MTDSPRFLAPSQATSVVPDFATPDAQPVAPVATPSMRQVIGANWTLAKQDQIGSQSQEEADAIKPVVARLDALDDRSAIVRGLMGSRYLAPVGGLMSGTLNNPYDMDAVFEGIAQHPDQFKDIPYKDPAAFSAWVQEQQARQRRDAQDVVGRESGIAQDVAGFATGIGAGFTDPVNLAGMMLTGGAGAAKTLVGGIAREALVNAAITAAQQPFTIGNRTRFGETTTAGDVATDIAEGAAGGAVFHGVGHLIGKGIGAIGDAIRGSDADLAAHVADTIPNGFQTPDTQAALHVVNRQADIDATNPFVPNAAGMDAHAASLTAAIGRLTETPVPHAPDTAPAIAGSLAAAPAPPVDLSPNRVIRFVMGDLEGGARVVHYSDADGGVTKYGIAAHANPGVDVANLSADQAASIARRKYWLPEYDRADPRTAAVAFDAGYVAGPEVGRRILHDSGGDPARALQLYRGYLDHIADQPGKAKYRTGWNNRLDKLQRFVGGSADRVAVRPEGFAGDDDGLAAAQRDLDQADMDAQLNAHELATARADEPATPADATELPSVQEGSAIGDSGSYFSPRVEGGAEQVVTPRGRSVDTRFEVREASDLIDSASPAFDQRLQPRDRGGRASSDVQIAQIAGNLDPAQLASSRLASQGAPIVGADGMVESGNGRVAAIRRAYADHPARAADYRAMIADRHPESATMHEPVLVRRRTTDMTPPERRAWVAEANERDTMGMSPAEQAGADARALTPETMATYRGGELTEARNRPFVRSFLNEVVNPSEHNSLVDREGAVNADGLRRINRAVLARAYDAPDLVAELGEAADTNIKAIGTVMQRIAPAMAQLRDMIADGRVDRQFDLAQPLSDLARRVRDARDADRPIGEILQQTDMFGGDVDGKTAALLRLFFRGQELTRPRATDTVAEALGDYIVAARQGPDFLGHMPTAEELIYAKRAEYASPDEGSFALAGRAGDRAAVDGEPSSGGRGRSGGDRGRPDAREDLEPDLAQARGEGAPVSLSDPHLARFDDPNGEGVEAVVSSIEHDIRAAFDGEAKAHAPADVDALPLRYRAEIEAAPEAFRERLIDDLMQAHAADEHDALRQDAAFAALPEAVANSLRQREGRAMFGDDGVLMAFTGRRADGRTIWWNPNARTLEIAEPRARTATVLHDVDSERMRSLLESDRIPSAVDPAIRERQRQQTALMAKSPMRAQADQDSMMGSPLFDAVDQPGFRLEEEGGELNPRGLFDELDHDQSAIDAAKGCL